MAAQLAIDSSGTRLRLMEFEGSGRRLRVLAVTEIDLDVELEDEEDDLQEVRAQLIRDALAELRMTSDPSALAFDATSALFREFDIPFTQDEQVAKVVRFESEAHIPLELDDVIIQHLVLRKARDKSHVLAVAVRKDALLARLELLDEAQVDPMYVDLDVFAYYNALVATGVVAEHGVAVAVHAEERSTSLLFLDNGSLFAVRSLRLGPGGVARDEFLVIVDDSEVGDLEEGDEEDELAERATAAPDLAEALAAQVSAADADAAPAADYVERLRRELRRTLITLPGLGLIERVWLSGSAGRDPELEDMLADVFGADVEPLDLLARVDHELDPDDAARHGPDLGVALGMAFRLNGIDKTATEFRREECAYTRRFDHVKSPLILLSFLGFLIAALALIDTIYSHNRTHGEYTLLLEHAQTQLAELLEDDAAAEAVWREREFGPQQMQAISSRVDALHDELSRQLGRSRTIPQQASALAAWIEFAVLLADNENALGRFAIHSLEISTSDRTPLLKVTGSMEDNSRYNRLLDLFERDALFTNLRPGKTSFDAQGRMQFSETVVEIDLGELRRRTVEDAVGGA